MGEAIILIIGFVVGILFGYGFWKEIGAKETRELERLNRK